MLNNLWQVRKSAPQKFFEQFPEINSLVLQLLYHRGLSSQKQIDEFLSPDYGADLHNPFLFLEMEKVVKRIFQAIENQEKILIYGDYDADGICASVILVDTLKSFGGQVEVYLPYRETEGYGLNKNAVVKIIENKINLVITVDCGIANVKEVELLNKEKIDVIISDHHQPREILPKAFAILNPKVEKESYPFKDLAACGVSFKLIQALFLKQDKYPVNQLPAGFEKWFLDLVAIGTIADLCSLLGENRTLVSYGLIVLQKTKRLGLQELVKVAGGQLSEINENSVGFQISPRLNAAGRMAHANTAYQLLITKDQKEAENLANQLNLANQKRQKLTDKITIEAKNQIGKVSNQKILFAKGASWPIGLIGLIAGKITDEFHRPTLVITKHQGRLIGSGRSIKKFNIIEALKKNDRYLIKFGGHRQACGFTLKEKNLPDFKKAIEEIAEQNLTKKDILPVLEIESLVNLEDIDWDFFENLRLFQPFGQANHKPRFLASGVKIVETKTLGNNNQHLKLRVSHQTPMVRKVIGFCLGENNKGEINWCQTLRSGDIIDIVFEVDENIWNGNRELQLKIVDLRLSEGGG